MRSQFVRASGHVVKWDRNTCLIIQVISIFSGSLNLELQSD